MPAVFTSAADLDAHLDRGAKHDVFVFEGADRQVVLKNDCRTYPLHLQATFKGDAEDAVDAFVDWCCETFGVEFAATIPGAKQARIPGLAVKVAAYAPLDTVEVHFYKSSPRPARRHVIEKLMSDFRF